jgi:hypothetical protein
MQFATEGGVSGPDFGAGKPANAASVARALFFAALPQQQSG